MSINALTDDELKNSVDPRQRGRTSGLGRLVRRAARPFLRRALPAAAAVLPTIPIPRSPLTEEDYIRLEQARVQDNRVSNALNALTKYIPTEAVTLYVATVSATPALQSVLPSLDGRVMYWTFGLVFAPLLLILVYIGKRKSAGISPLPSLRRLPWWRTIAATVAFLAWALAVPTNPYITGQIHAILASIAAVFVSTFLTLLEPIFE